MQFNKYNTCFRYFFSTIIYFLRIFTLHSERLLELARVFRAPFFHLFISQHIHTSSSFKIIHLCAYSYQDFFLYAKLKPCGEPAYTNRHSRKILHFLHFYFLYIFETHLRFMSWSSFSFLLTHSLSPYSLKGRKKIP